MSCLLPNFKTLLRNVCPRRAGGARQGAVGEGCGQLRPAILHGLRGQTPGSVSSCLPLLSLKNYLTVAPVGCVKRTYMVLLWCQQCTEVEPREKQLETHVRVASLVTVSHDKDPPWLACREAFTNQVPVSSPVTSSFVHYAL